MFQIYILLVKLSLKKLKLLFAKYASLKNILRVNSTCITMDLLVHLATTTIGLFLVVNTIGLSNCEITMPIPTNVTGE